MACSSPLTAWYSAERNESGKRSIVFNPSKAYTDLPLTIPCGQCLGCKADQALMWSIRAYHESTLHKQNSFLTLTYSDENLPQDGKIKKKELQDFFKRLRKHIHPEKIRYIACGEYGDQTRRPHYHAILFGMDFLDDKITVTDKLYTSPTLVKVWGKGHVTIAEVNMSTICYVCGYVLKKMKEEETFNLASRRPGIGKEWLDKYKRDLLATGTVTIEGREYPVPPRYLQQEEDYLLAIKQARKKYAMRQQKKLDPVTRGKRAAARDINRKALTSKRKENL